jgi:hypothetical protein
VSPPRVKPWHPSACSRPLPWGRGELTRAARLFSCAFPAAVWLKQPRGQVSALPRRVWFVCPFCGPRSSSCWSSGAVGRWSGRAGPSGPKGGGEGHPPAVWRRASRPHHRPCQLGAALAARRRASALPGGAEAPDEPALGRSPSVVLVPRGWGSVSHRSAGTAVYPPSSVRDRCHPHGHAGSGGVAHRWCGPAARPPTRARQKAAAP